MREAIMKENNITAEASRRRADVARQLADMAVCPDTKAFFLVLQQRWTERPRAIESGMIDRGGQVTGRPFGEEHRCRSQGTETSPEKTSSD
jgi:hypothetical protein